MTVGISGKIVKVKSKNIPDGAIVTASKQLFIDGKEIKDKIFIKKTLVKKDNKCD